MLIKKKQQGNSRAATSQIDAELHDAKFVMFSSFFFSRDAAHEESVRGV